MGKEQAIAGSSPQADRVSVAPQRSKRSRAGEAWPGQGERAIPALNQQVPVLPATQSGPFRSYFLHRHKLWPE